MLSKLLWKFFILQFFYFYKMILRQTSDLTKKPCCIISLVPSQTELLHYLQLDDETIAITKFCIHPAEWFRNKIRIGGTKNLDIKKITELKPDLIIANKEENNKEQVQALAKEFNVWVTDVNNFNDALVMINDIGQLTDSMEKTATLISVIKQQFALLPIRPKLKNAAYLIWKDPYMTTGGDTFISSMMEIAGFKNIFANTKRYPQITILELQHSKCDLIFLSSEPYPFSQKHIDELQRYLPAVKIILADGEIFSWYGSRMLLAPAYFLKLASATSFLL